MDNKTIFVVTLKGEGEIKNHTRQLPEDAKRVLVLVDDESTVEILARRAAPSLRAGLGDMLQKLENGGFIQEKASARTGNVLRMVTPKISVPVRNEEETGDLDFTSGISVPPPTADEGEQAKAKMARLKSEQEATAIRGQLEAERAKAEQEAAKSRAELGAARLETERARAELEAAKMKAEALAKQEIEAARLRENEAKARAHAEAEASAKQEAEMARLKAEQEAAKLRAEAEAARMKAEALAKQEAEAALLREKEAKARAHAEAEARAKQEAEMARLKAEQEATKARAEAEAARMKAEALAKQEAEAALLREKEAKAKVLAEAEARAKQEAEMARLKAEQEAAKVRAEAEAARMKAEALAKQEIEAARLREKEAKAKAIAEAEARVKQEAEMARLKAAQEAAKVRAEAEAMRIKAELEAAWLEAERARAELEAAKVEAKALAKREAEAALLREEEAAAKVRAEAEVARIKAEQEVVRIKAEAEAKAKQEAEAARRKAEEEAAKAKAEAESTRLKAAQAAARAKEELDAALAKAAAEAQTRAKAKASARAEAEAKARQEVDAAILRAEQEIAKARAEAEAKAKREAEAAQLKAEREIARIKAETEAQVRQATQAKEDAESALSTKAKADASAARSMIATVLFFDVVGYTKQSVSKQIELKAQFNKLVSKFITDIEENQRIILDTGDGAAIGFLQHPEDAIEVALKFRQAMTANKHRDYPDLMVKIGIHLGPVNIVKDMNGQSNMVGDGINDAQRIMNFASFDQIYISRSYYDVVSRLSAEYANLFQYRGVRNDKHGRQHQVYEATVDETEEIEQPSGAGQPGGQQESAPFSINLEPFMSGFGQTATVAPTQLPNIASEEIPDQEGQATIAQEQAKVVSPEKIEQEKVTQKTQQEIEAEAQVLAEQKALQEAKAARIKVEQEAAKAKAEKEARQMADEQAKTWAEAEQRAKAQMATQANVEHEVQQPVKTPKAKAVQPASHARRKPISLGKIVTSLFVLLLALIAALPYVWPMQDYVAQLEKKLSAQLQQPVHIAQMKAAWLPLPKLELQDVSVGGAQELKAASVVLNFDVTTLFSETKVIKTVEVNDLALNADFFRQALGWLQAAGGDAHYPVTRMVLERAHISGEGLSLPPVNGSADWDAQGHISKALLRSEDGKLDVELQSQESRWQIALRIKESILPWLPGILFKELNAKGEADEGAADFTEVDGQLYEGRLAGNAHLNWRKGWQMQGHLSIKAMELQKALPQFGIEGELDGDSNFLLNGATLPQLANAPDLDGTFIVKKGVISKINMVESATNRQGMSGGRTHFDELSGTLQVENNSKHLRQIKISAGVMSAFGSVDVSPDKELSGRLSIDLKMRAGSTPLILSGTLTEPVLHQAR